MDEVEKIADRLLMLKDGQSVLYGKVNDVRREFGDNIIQLEYTGRFEPNDKLFTAKIEKNYAELNPNEGINDEQILGYLLQCGVQIKRFEVTSPSLNEIFIKVVSK
jgi:ABC-2 type transport system ATP-binding protein